MNPKSETLAERITENVLRRLDRISPRWAGKLREGKVPFDGGTDGLNICDPLRCVVGEARGFAKGYHARGGYKCEACSYHCGQVITLSAYDLGNFIDHFEECHMEKPEIAEVPLEVEVHE